MSCNYRENGMEKKNVCVGEHAVHICVKGTTMFSYGDLDPIKELVRNPQFICGNCGRVAAKAENLCNPVPLKG